MSNAGNRIALAPVRTRFSSAPFSTHGNRYPFSPYLPWRALRNAADLTKCAPKQEFPNERKTLLGTENFESLIPSNPLNFKPAYLQTQRQPKLKLPSMRVTSMRKSARTEFRIFAASTLKKKYRNCRQQPSNKSGTATSLARITFLLPGKQSHP